MTIGPAPMIRIEEMSVRLGMDGVLEAIRQELLIARDRPE
jgi:hypothetical protein